MSKPTPLGSSRDIPKSSRMLAGSPAPALECPVEAPEESGLLVRRMAMEDQGYLHLGQAQGTQLAPVLGSKVDLDPPGRVLDKD